MKDFFSHLYFARPLFLLPLFLLPLLWLPLRRRTLAVLFWRTAVCLLVVVALADPEQTEEEVTRGGERIFAFDLSQSIPPEMRLWMEKQRLVPNPGDRTFVFGAEAKEVTDWRRWVDGEVPASPVKPEKTDLEALFSTLLRLPPAPRTLFLFTDGWETQGSVDHLLPSLALSGLKVFPVVPSFRPSAANVTVKKVIIPNEGTKGDGINLRVLVENANGGEIAGRLILKVNGRIFRNQAIRIGPGNYTFNFPATLPDGPLASFSAAFTPESPASDAFPMDNQATSWVAVRPREKVLLLNGRNGEGKYLEEILKRRGFNVTSVVVNTTPPTPSRYGIVIFNNVEKEKFPPGYLAAIERHVAAGNGFLMLGGGASFGPGGYRQTPIEALLPVELKEPKKEEKSRAVILVIDKSGSMREENKLVYAKEAAKAVSGQLKDTDLVGVVGFDVSPFVVVPLSPVEKVRATFAAQVDRLKAGGRTYLYPAIVEAKRQLERQNASRKHVIILSDGETGGSGSDYVDLVSVMKNDLKMTVSAVAIGDEANIPLLKRIAQYGGGLFHHTYDPATLPKIVLEQMREEPKEEAVVERNFTPVAVKGSEVLSGFSEAPFPVLRGYVETELKRGAHQDVTVPKEAKGAPLLASWNYGKGKAVAFTTDLNGHWSRDWIQWRQLERFWEKVFDWLEPPQTSLPPYEVRINMAADQPIMDFYLYGENHTDSVFRFSFNGKGGSGQGSLNRLAPGHYQGSLSISSPGDYRIELSEERLGKKIFYPPIGYTLPYNPKTEIPQPNFNFTLLERLAHATGGEINPGEQQLIEKHKIFYTHRPLRTNLILLAIVFFLLDVTFRRIFSS